MKIVVIGGTGLIGSKLSKKLAESDYEVIAASPSKGIDALTGKGLAKALKGASIVVDVSNSPSFEDKAVLDFFERSGHNLMAEERAAGVRHHIALSVVGTDVLPESGYFRAKLAQEKLIIASGIPYTIVRATQFFEFLEGIIQSSTVEQTVRLPNASIQPIAAEDVAKTLFDVVSIKPINGIIEVAGPERFQFAEIVERYLKATNDPRKVLGDEHSRYFGAKLSKDTLVPKKNSLLGSTNFKSWLELQQTTSECC
jgi:uncharacterized protein YbjT (DUF2867 family)